MPDQKSTPETTQEIRVDLMALRQDRADRALGRDSVEIVDFSTKLTQLREFSVLSSFARCKERKN